MRTPEQERAVAASPIPLARRPRSSQRFVLRSSGLVLCYARGDHIHVPSVSRLHALTRRGTLVTHPWFRPTGVRVTSADSAASADANAIVAAELVLVRRVCTGDEVAFEQIFRTYYVRLVSFATTNVGSQALAEEMVQEVFLQIWMRREQWVVERSLAAYLFRSVRNRILNARRSLRLETAYATDVTRETEIEPSESSDGALREGEIGAALAHAIALLPERPRQVFLLSRRQGLSYSEIGDVLGIALKTVEMHMGRALAQLRISLGEWRRP